tara:strand:- start:6930 stop:11687 length:4758 start_codon:yes stop_codon:yes gene_type:complete
MADIKNFGIRGIGADVQFGKAGGRVVYDSGNSLFKITTDGTTLGNMSAATPTLDTHVTTKGYVDSVASGLDVKDSVRVASTTDVNTSTPPAAIDGVTLSAGDRILLKDQSTDTQNGIYTYDASGLTRATDMDAAGEFVGAFFFVEEGTVNSDQGFVMTSDGPITVGATSIAFTKFTGTGQITAGAALSKSGNTLLVNVDNSFIEVNGSDELTIKGTNTTGQVLQSDGSGGVAYGTVDLTSANSVAGALGLANGGLGVDASQAGGKTTARSNLGLGSMAVQDANSVAITGGSVDLSGGTLTLANDQLSGDVISGGTIDSADLQGGAGKTISQYDITVGATRSLDVDGTLDVDGAAGSAIDNVAIGATTSAAGTFSTLASGGAAITGGTIDGTVIGGTTPANGTFVTLASTGTMKADSIEANTGGGDVTFGSDVIAPNLSVGTGTLTGDAVSTDTISEKTNGNGVAIDGVTMQDGNVTANVGTFTTSVIATADINGGAIDGTTIGAGTSGAGTFSTMTTSSAAITGGTIAGTAINMTGQTLTFDNDAISGDSIDGGTISDFASTGIDDNATSTQLTITDSDITMAGNAIVTGNLTVNGTLTSVNTTNTEIADNSIVLNNGETAAGVTAGTAGIEIDRGTADNATIQWNETTDAFEFKVGTALADLTVGSQAMDGISVDTISEKTGSAGITFANDVTGGNATFTTKVMTDTIDENSTAAGVTIDGALLKDGVLTGGVTLGATDTADLSAGTLTLANDQISGDAIEGGTIGSITISSLVATTADIDAGTIDNATIGGSTSAAGTFTTMTTDSADINGGAIDGTAIGANTSAAGTFSSMTSASVAVTGGAIDGTTIGGTTPAAVTASTLNSANAQITGGAISGASLTSSTVDIDGGAIDGTTIGANTSAAGTFSTMTTNNASVTGGSVTVTTLSGTNFSTANASITGGSIASTDVDMSGQTLTLDNDQISGDAIHSGTISGSDLQGAAGSAMSGYDITVGAGKTLDISNGTLTLANDQLSGDAIDGGTISNFKSTGITDTATATKLTVDDTDATFGVNIDAGTNTLAAGATTLASLNVTGNAVVSGDLTVSGSVTTTLSETVNIEDNIIVLNSNETGAPTANGGIEINRGTSDSAALNWNETSDAFELKVGTAAADLTINDLTVNEITLTNELPLSMGGTHTDTSAFAADSIMVMSGSAGVSELAVGGSSTVLKVNASGVLGYAQVDLTADVSGALPIANGGTGLTASDSDRKVMFSDGSAFGMEFIQHVRNSSGGVAIQTANATSGTAEFLDITNAADKLYLTAKNAAGTGAVDMYLQGQNGGDVFIVGQSGDALLQGEADTDLTLAGGDSSAGDAGDLVLKGGNGSASGVSGHVVIKGGNGGATDGHTEIRGADDTEIMLFKETAGAGDYFEATNGTGSVNLSGLGTSTDVNIVLEPKGDGLVLAPSGYDMSGGGNNAFATKDYVDGAAAGSVDFGLRRVSFSANGSSSFTIGTVANVSGKSYYVSRITAKVTTAFVGADEIIVSDGTNNLMTADEADLSEGGVYVVDLGYETATAGGATLTASIQSGGASASPTTGVVIVTAEYKQI